MNLLIYEDICLIFMTVSRLFVFKLSREKTVCPSKIIFLDSIIMLGSTKVHIDSFLTDKENLSV